jgi:hypothetical protein
VSGKHTLSAQPYDSAAGDDADTGSIHQSPFTKRQCPSSSNCQPLQTPHSIIERRYRHKIKFQLDSLVTKIPALKKISAGTSAIGNPDHLTKSPSKALVIASAVEHIEKLESDSAKTNKFVKALQEQITGLQDLVRENDVAVDYHLQAGGGLESRKKRKSTAE